MTKPPEEAMYAMRRALVSFDATYNPQTPDERIRSILAAAEQSGWRLVPDEPTKEMIEDMAIKLYEERARNLGLPMAKWENAPELVRSLERRDAATAYRLVLAAAPKVTGTVSKKTDSAHQR